ncbi:MAG: CehA/McbA family metallohydrolase [bacterium]
MRKTAILIAAALPSVLSAPCLAGYARGNRVEQGAVLREGEVRAAVVRDASELIGGPKAEGRVGDFKIYNRKVGFIIAGARPSSGYSPLGGMIEDAGLLRCGDDGCWWWNIMGDVFPTFFRGDDSLFGARLFAPVSAEVLKDGAGGEAIVRVRGRDAEFPIRKEFFNRGSSPLKVGVIIDYVLKPDAASIEVRTTIVNEGKSGSVFSIGLVFMLGDGLDLFFPDYGLEWEKVRGTVVAKLAASGSGMAYGWFVPETGIHVHEKISSLVITTAGRVKAPPGSSASHSYYLMVGDADVASVYEEKYRLEAREDIGYVEGRCVTKGTGEPAPGVIVHALSPLGNARSQALVRPDGTFRFVLRPEEYHLLAASYERDDPQPVPVQVERGAVKNVVLEIEPPARLEYEIADDAGNLIPATISFKRIEGKPIRLDDNKLHRSAYGGGFYKNHFTASGKGAVDVRPGKYQVYFSCGVEYEYETRTATLAAGETAVEKVTLRHVVNTSGFLSGDFHVHSRPSPDSDDTIYDKALGAAAVGLEVPVATDHDRYTDYKPYIRELGIENHVNSIVGDELTTIRLGHFNAFPLTFDPALRNEGAIDWYGLTAPEIFRAFRDDPGDVEFIQVNHPRTVGGGYFDFVGYDPKTGAAADTVNFSLDFDGMEVLNGTGYNDLQYTVPDWYGFLNRGKRVTGIGNSDSHQVYRLQIGYPRNYVVSPTDNPDEMDETGFVNAVLQQRVSVCGGAFVWMTANGAAAPGDVVTDTDGTVELRVKVQAPSWIEPEKLVIVANGEEIAAFPLAGDTAPVWFDDTVSVSPAADTWYVARVEGTKPMFPVYPGARPYSFTNPVYVDADGNGAFDPPLSFP